MEQAVNPLHSQNLKAIIKHLGFKSAKSFAENVGLSQSEVSLVLAGKRHISPAMAWTIIKSYRQFSIYWILDGEGGMLNYPNLEEKNDGIVSEPSMAYGVKVDDPLKVLERRVEVLEQRINKDEG
jgi:hypothetical protein